MVFEFKWPIRSINHIFDKDLHCYESVKGLGGFFCGDTDCR